MASMRKRDREGRERDRTVPVLQLVGDFLFFFKQPGG